MNVIDQYEMSFQMKIIQKSYKHHFEWRATETGFGFKRTWELRIENWKLEG